MNVNSIVESENRAYEIVALQRELQVINNKIASLTRNGIKNTDLEELENLGARIRSRLCELLKINI